MENFEIIVKKGDEALRLQLPKKVVERIKQLSHFTDDDFDDSDIEKVLKMVVKSLDSLLYGFDNIHPHGEKKTKTSLGEVSSKKEKNGEKE